MGATEAQLKEIKEKAEAAGLLPEFETLVLETIEREKRILELDNLAKERGELLVATAVAVGWRPDVTPPQLAHLPRQVKGLKAKSEAVTANGGRAYEVKSWVLGFLEGAEFEIPNADDTPEDVVRHLAAMLKDRQKQLDEKPPGDGEPESDGDS